MGDTYQSDYYAANRERILARKREAYARRREELRASSREKTRAARVGRRCAICETPIGHLTTKALYCGRSCKNEAARRRTNKPRRSRGVCVVGGCERDVASRGLCGPHNHRQRRYGLTAEQMEALDSGIMCEICREQRATHVDHCHQRGEGHARGFLCRSCNLGLGNYLDRPELLEAAAAYLRRES